MVTIFQLAQIAVDASYPRISNHLDALNKAMADYSITTPLRQAAFMACVCYASGSFYVLRELELGNNYEGRADLGNIEPGDGPRFKGRGLLQIKGRLLYGLCGNELDIDLINNPDLLQEKPHSSDSAAWYWSEFMNLNLLADKSDFLGIIRRLTNGYSGLVKHVMYYERARLALGLRD